MSMLIKVLTAICAAGFLSLCPAKTSEPQASDQKLTPIALQKSPILKPEPVILELVAPCKVPNQRNCR